MQTMEEKQIIEKTDNKDVEKIVCKNFDDIPANTKTIIVMTNITIDLQKLFESLPITEYIVVPKERGRKKKSNIPDPNANIADGSIVTLDLAGNIRGVLLKKKKKKSGKGNYFRNSLTVVMFTDKKKINFKISRNGKFQMTGCQKDEQAENCVKYIWRYIKDNKEIYKFSKEKSTNFKALFVPAMRNIDFSLGFTIDRENLTRFFNNIDNPELSSYRSLYEPTIGYTGVNIKKLITKPITELKIKKKIYKGDNWHKTKMVSYVQYLSTMTPSEQKKKMEQDRDNTFLVFQSGKVIMSSMCSEVARDAYYEFINIIKENKECFKEYLDI